MVEQRAVNAEVEGSSPSPSANGGVVLMEAQANYLEECSGRNCREVGYCYCMCMSRSHYPDGCEMQATCEDCHCCSGCCTRDQNEHKRWSL